MIRPDSRSPGKSLRRLGLAGSTLVVLLAGACGPAPVSEGPFTIDLLVSPTPASVGDARLLVTVNDSLRRPVEGARVRVRATLNDTTEVSREAPREDPGRYGIDAFPFSRSGDWRVIVIVEDSAGPDRGRRSFPVHVVSSG